MTLDVVGRVIRNELGVTTDVWAHNGYAYTGTFSTLCSTGDNDSGIWIWDVHNVNKVSFVGVIDSAAGSKANDVRVAAMNSGDILVLSNESCAGGPGGFDIYNVDDPANPVFESRVQIDELNPISDALFGGLSDVGVHNLWLFTDGANDYVAVTSEGAFDNFRVYDITGPSSPTLASSWGAEELFDPGVGEETADVNRVLTAALDPANGSLDGEVNSHSVWPSEDGSIVIEGEEDFSAWEGSIPPSNLTSTAPPHPAIGRVRSSGRLRGNSNVEPCASNHCCRDCGFDVRDPGGQLRRLPVLRCPRLTLSTSAAAAQQRCGSVTCS